MGIVKLNILDVLQEKNMSLEEFAALPGIGEESANKIGEGPVSAVRFSTLAAICDGLGCKPGDVLAIPPSDYRQRVVAGGLPVMTLRRHLR